MLEEVTLKWYIKVANYYNGINCHFTFYELYFSLHLKVVLVFNQINNFMLIATDANMIM